MNPRTFSKKYKLQTLKNNCLWSLNNFSVSTLLLFLLFGKIICFSLMIFQAKYDFLFIALIFRSVITEHLTGFNKFDTFRKPRPSGIFKWKIFWKKEKLKLKKREDEIFNVLCNIATARQILITKTSVLFYHENVVFI